MSDLDIIRAWKDEEYRLSLSEDLLAMLPDNPAGLVEFTDPLRAQEDPIQCLDTVANSCLNLCLTTNCYTELAGLCSLYICPTQAPCPIPISITL